MINKVTILFVCTLLSFSSYNSNENNLIHNIHFQQKESISWTTGWSYDDQFVAIGNDNGELSIYETRHWKKIKTWHYKATIISKLEWNPKYPLLAVAATSYKGTDSIVQIYDIVKNKTLKFFPDSLQGRGVSWSADGEKFAFTGNAGRINIYSKTGIFLKTLSFRNPGSLFDIDWHPHKNLILGVEENIYPIDIDRDSLISSFDDGSKNKGILCCQWHPSGNFFVTGDYGHENEGGEPSYLKFWNTKGKLLKQLKETKFEYRNLRWTMNGNFLAASSDVLLIINDRGDVKFKIKFDDNHLWGIAWNKAGDKNNNKRCSRMHKSL